MIQFALCVSQPGLCLYLLGLMIRYVHVRDNSITISKVIVALNVLNMLCI